MSDLKAFGLAMHGLVIDGQLTLPNSSIVNYSQPSDGHCALLKLFNAVTPPTLNTANTAAMTNAGLEFRDYSFISGNGVAGKAMDGQFIHQSADGKRWAVNVDGITVKSSGTLAGGSITLTEFGNIYPQYYNLQPNTITLNVADIDIQQSAPVVSWLIQSGIYVGESVTLEAYEAVFLAASPDGSEAILSLSGGGINDGNGSKYDCGDIGFLSLKIDNLVATLSVYKNRVDTLGSYIHSDYDSSALLQRSWGLINPPGESAYWELDPINTENMLYSQLESYGDVVGVIELSNRIVSVGFDQNGQYVDFVLDYRSDSISTSAQAASSGTTITQSETNSASFTVTLSAGVNSIQIVGSSSGQNDYSLTFDESAETMSITTNLSGSSSIDGDSTTLNESGTYDVTGDPSDYYSYYKTYSVVSYNLMLWNTGRAGIADAVQKIQIQNYYTDISSKRNYYLNFIKHGPNMVLFRKDRVEQSTVYSYAGAITSISVDETRKDHPIGQALSVGHTHNPSTGEIVFAYPGAVCFV